MVTKKSTARAKGKSGETGSRKSDSSPKFPYTTKPASLRKFLKDIPQKPKPTKFNKDLLKAWGFSDTNDMTMLRVLKSVNLLNEKNEPTDLYARFMNLDEGAKALGPEVKRVYAQLFQASHTPYAENNEKLQNLFNIHSGGGARALDQQIQTFKALCENATFDQAPKTTATTGAGTSFGTRDASLTEGNTSSTNPMININLHIHLPENKTRRDYEDIIEDIGRYIFGRSQQGDRRD